VKKDRTIQFAHDFALDVFRGSKTKIPTLRHDRLNEHGAGSEISDEACGNAAWFRQTWSEDAISEHNVVANKPSSPGPCSRALGQHLGQVSH